LSGFCVAHLFESDLRKLGVNELHYSQCQLCIKAPRPLSYTVSVVLNDLVDHWLVIGIKKPDSHLTNNNNKLVTGQLTKVTTSNEVTDRLTA
jgi:flagellar biogenesis protein FliO